MYPPFFFLFSIHIVSHQSRGYYDALRELVEEMYDVSNEPVAFVVHSMGGMMSLYFLNEVVTQEWKNKYIKVYIPLSAAWAGAGISLEAVVAGLFPSQFQVPIEVRRSLEASYWLMPRAEAYGDQVLVQTPTTNYTAKDYQQMFTTFANYSLGWTQYMQTSTINAGYRFPGVPTHCLYGSDTPTPLTFIYSSDDAANTNLTIQYGGGDGVVDKVSLEVCLKWRSEKSFQWQEFSGVNHGGMVRDTIILEAISGILDGGSSGSKATAANIFSVIILLATAVVMAVV